jgi:arginine-tRNA-protein transferase
VDASFAAGDRRVGPLLYRTRCPACSACEPLRIPVDTFRMDRSQRRAWAGNRDLTVEVGPVVVDAERIDLFSRHRAGRGLARGTEPMDEGGYARWFAESCVPTVEMAYRKDGRLLGVAILDVGARDTSAVYTYFDPDASRRSLGTWSVLAQIAWLRARGGRHHYLGLHVADCRHLAYKSRFRPHERLLDGRWVAFP